MWKYQFTVQNPGRFPITNVEVWIEFQIDVNRQHYDGTVDESQRHLQMGAPAIPANAHKSWNRTPS